MSDSRKIKLDQAFDENYIKELCYNSLPQNANQNKVTEEEYLNNLFDKNGDTPLTWAVTKGKVLLARALLQKKANPDNKNEAGISPRQIANDHGFRQILIEIDDVQSASTPIFRR